jgi:hypothetical protein
MNKIKIPNPVDILLDIACKVAKKHRLIVDEQSFVRARNHYATIEDLNKYNGD